MDDYSPALTLKLKTFIATTPEYAILSHTWGTDEEEVTFQELQTPSPETVLKKGYKKIKTFCELARDDGYEWAWVDTCCIDKTSSAELSESINSMYKCRDWRELSSRQDLRELISETTGIEPTALVGHFVPGRYTVAVRMSWAAHRITTREEDMAYSLLGLFNVNMPLIYGEGAKAFERLQQEILKDTEDYTLLAWRSRPRSPDDMSLDPTSVLAKSPWDFRNGGLASEAGGWSYNSIRLIDWNPFDVSAANFKWHGRPLIGGWAPSSDFEPPKITSRGLRITLPFLTSLSPATKLQDETSLAFLYSVGPAGEMVCIALRKNDIVNSSVMKGDYYRTLASSNPRFVSATSVKFEFRTVYIRSKPREEQPLVSRWTKNKHPVLVFDARLNGRRMMHEPLVYDMYEPQTPLIITARVGVRLVFIVAKIGELPHCFIDEPPQQSEFQTPDGTKLAGAANRSGKLTFRMELSTSDKLQCSLKSRAMSWRNVVAPRIIGQEGASRLHQATNLYSLDLRVKSADEHLPIRYISAGRAF
ncbi:hypothetical protein PG989_002558 [Apiospora arundinis]